MVRVINAPRLIQAAGSPQKTIAEYIGQAVSGTEQVSIAMMKSPPGWSEPGQIPDFDEYSLVLSGTLKITTRTEEILLASGQAAIAPAGEWVRYSSPEGADYLAVCLPAFSQAHVHRDDQEDPVLILHQPGTGEIRYDEYGEAGLVYIEDLWNELRAHHASHARYFRDQIQERTFEERCHDIVKTNVGRTILVQIARSSDPNLVIGFCICSAAPGEYGEIESIYVKPEFRSRGIGTTLMTRAGAWCEEKNVTGLQVGVCEGNEDSFRFYERFGFYIRRHILIRRNTES